MIFDAPKVFFDLKVQNVSILDIFNGGIFDGSICISDKRITFLSD